MTLFKTVDSIDGWNYVFDVGNFLADAAIAAFAIKSGYMDKKFYETIIAEEDEHKKENA